MRSYLFIAAAVAALSLPAAAADRCAPYFDSQGREVLDPCGQHRFDPSKQPPPRRPAVPPVAELR
jgi:N-acetyl-gamma-glutamylphosphate reductase